MATAKLTVSWDDRTVLPIIKRVRSTAGADTVTVRMVRGQIPDDYAKVSEKGGRLIAFDQDPDARREAEKLQHRSLTFCPANFMYLKRYLRLNGVTRVNGVLADLGMSSHQIDSPDRGFSTRFAGPLDMRMDQTGEVTAATIVNE
jgi:16S rRNA C1402 N4-methylase RsmH